MALVQVLGGAWLVLVRLVGEVDDQVLERGLAGFEAQALEQHVSERERIDNGLPLMVIGITIAACGRAR